jgi:formylmethanofuran dehydrogenase subunit B
MNNQNHKSAPLIATCPACGLLCDDVTLNFATALSLQNGCVKGIRFFENAFNTAASASPMLSGKPASLETAINAAAEILNHSVQPLFAGLGTEVLGMRSLMSLAKHTNATLDHMHSEATVSNTRTMQNSGWLTTTMAEVKNRADIILAIGTDITSTHPRFFEKLAWNINSLFSKPTPELIFLGASEARAKMNIAPDGKVPTIIPAEITQLPEVINALNTLLNGKKINVEIVAGIPTNTLIALIEKLKTAKYAVIVWSASALKIPHAELTIQSIAQMISKLNENSRAAGLPLNSGDGDSSVNNVSTWLSGYPTRSRFNNGIPEYDTYHFETAKQLASCDALLWVSTFNSHPIPETQAPVIVIGHPDTQFERMPEVFIPVGIPGVDHSGQMFRMDSSITLPLKKLRETNLPSLSEVIGKIEAKISGEAKA